MGALFSSLFTTLSISYVYLTNTIFMKFRKTLGSLKEFLLTKVNPVQLRQIWALEHSLDVHNCLQQHLSEDDFRRDLCREQ